MRISLGRSSSSTMPITRRRLGLVELVAALQQADQLLEQPPDLLGLLAAGA